MGFLYGGAMGGYEGEPIGYGGFGGLVSARPTRPSADTPSSRAPTKNSGVASLRTSLSRERAVLSSNSVAVAVRTARPQSSGRTI